MSAVKCSTCQRVLAEGESAWASDWGIIDVRDGSKHTETRYTCDDCEAAA